MVKIVLYYVTFTTIKKFLNISTLHLKVYLILFLLLGGMHIKLLDICFISLSYTSCMPEASPYLLSFFHSVNPAYVSDHLFATALLSYIFLAPAHTHTH